MQVAPRLQQVIDYNTLETVFLITSTLILIGGMMFQSSTLHPGSLGYLALTGGLVVMIVASAFTFFCLLAYEAVRAFRFGRMFAKAARHTKSRAKFLKSPSSAHLNVRELERLFSTSSGSTHGSPTPQAGGRVVVTSPVVTARALAAQHRASALTASPTLPPSPPPIVSPSLVDPPNSGGESPVPFGMVEIPLNMIRRNPMLDLKSDGSTRSRTPSHISAAHLHGSFSFDSDGRYLSDSDDGTPSDGVTVSPEAATVSPVGNTNLLNLAMTRDPDRFADSPSSLQRLVKAQRRSS